MRSHKIVIGKTLTPDIDAKDGEKLFTILSYGSDSTVTVGDLSEANPDIVLKFVEEASFPIIGYASRDNISPTLLSRFPIIEKHPSSIFTPGKKSCHEASEAESLPEELALLPEELVRTASIVRRKKYRQMLYNIWEALNAHE